MEKEAQPKICPKHKINTFVIISFISYHIHTSSRFYTYEVKRALIRLNKYKNDIFGIADLTRPQLPKCNNHLVSFIKVDGLSVPYIVNIFDTIKSRT